MGWSRKHWRALLLGLGVFLVGLIAGAGTGGSTETITATQTDLRTTTEVETVTKTIRVRPTRTVTKTVTRVQTKRVSVPPPAGLYWDDGGYSDFEYRGLNWYHKEYGGVEVAGQLVSTSGCGGYVQIDGTFFNADGRVIGTGIANFDGMPAGSGIPFTVNLLEDLDPRRVELIITQADC